MLSHDCCPFSESSNIKQQILARLWYSFVNHILVTRKQWSEITCSCVRRIAIEATQNIMPQFRCPITHIEPNTNMWAVSTSNCVLQPNNELHNIIIQQQYGTTTEHVVQSKWMGRTNDTWVCVKNTFASLMGRLTEEAYKTKINWSVATKSHWQWGSKRSNTPKRSGNDNHQWPIWF